MAFRILRFGRLASLVFSLNACSFAAAPVGPIEDFLDAGSSDAATRSYDAAAPSNDASADFDAGETISSVGADAGVRFPDGGFVFDAFVSIADGELPACHPSVDGLTGCETGLVCYIVDGYGTTACLEPGTLAEGDSCDARSADDRADSLCEPGLICSGVRATCRKLCAVERPRCGASEICEPLLYGAGDLGVCVPNLARSR